MACDTSDSFRLVVRFRPLAWAACICFFATMVLSGVLTFTITDYTRETDKITIFYGVFNPCIFFDHYPAKIVATVGIGAFVIIFVTFAGLVFLRDYSMKSVVKTGYSAATVFAYALCNVCFVNVFTTDLYPEKHRDSRRLHGVHEYGTAGNSTISLLDERQRLSPDDLHVVLLHTSFYVAWVVAEFAFSIRIASLACKTAGHAGKKLAWSLIFIVGWSGMLLHAASMLIVILYGDAWIKSKDLDNPVQKFVYRATLAVQAGTWGWLPIMFYRFIIPSDLGVSATFRLSKTRDDGSVNPNIVLGHAMNLMFFMIVSGAVFNRHLKNDSSTRILKLASSMRSKPYAYFAAPAYLVCVMLAGLGFSLTLVQRRLEVGRWPLPEYVLVTVMMVCIYASLLVILEDERFTWVFVLVFLVAYNVWVVVINCARRERRYNKVLVPALYLLGWVPVFYIDKIGFLVCTWLLFSKFVLPAGPVMYITLGQVDCGRATTCAVELPRVPDEEGQ